MGALQTAHLVLALVEEATSVPNAIDKVGGAVREYLPQLEELFGSLNADERGNIVGNVAPPTVAGESASC